MRHKVKLDDRFLEHKGSVIQLGKDMHLLDLRSTRYVNTTLTLQLIVNTLTLVPSKLSIHTSNTMEMFILNVDDGDLDRIHEPGFSTTKRIVWSEQQVNDAIFRSNKVEARASETCDMSSLITGGAG